MAGTKNLYNTDPSEVLIEALELANGIKLQRQYVDVTADPLDGSSTLVKINPKLINGYSPYVNPINLIIDKLNLSAQIPKDMCYSGQYPATYEAFYNFLIGSYGLMVKSGQWEISAGGNIYPLVPGSVISADLAESRYLTLRPTEAHPIFSDQMEFVLYVTDSQNSVPQLTLQIVGPSVANVGDTIAIQFMAAGGLEPYTFTKIAGTYPVPLNPDGDGLEGQLMADGTYNYIVEVADALNQITQTNASITVSLDTLVADDTAPDGIVGEPYAHQYRLMGGVKPYQVVHSEGIPLGLDLDLNGYLHGMADEGEHSYLIEFEDSLGSRFSLLDTITIAPRTLSVVRSNTLQSMTDWLELSGGHDPAYILQSHPTATHWQAVELSHQNLRSSHVAAVDILRGYFVKTSPQEALQHIAVAFWGTRGFISMGGSIFSTVDGDSGFEVSVSDTSDDRLRVSVTLDGQYYGFETPAGSVVLDDTMALITVQAAEGWLSVHRNLELVVFLRIPDAPRVVTADTPFTVGRRSSFPGGYQWNGTLERVMVFRERLWGDQISFLYNQGQSIEYRDLLEDTADALPAITFSASFTDGEIGVPYLQEIVFQGPPLIRAPIICEGSLPLGLTMDTSDLSRWVVSGTPLELGVSESYWAAQGAQQCLGVVVSISIVTPVIPE